MNPLWYLGAAIDTTNRRVAFIASADMSHRHDADGPYGFEPAAGECDTRIREAIESGTLDQLADYDGAWLERAFTDAVEPLLILHGLTAGRGWRGETLSYEVPTYFGMLCAAYAPT